MTYIVKKHDISKSIDRHNNFKNNALRKSWNMSFIDQCLIQAYIIVVNTCGAKITSMFVKNKELICFIDPTECTTTTEQISLKQ